MGHGDMEGRRPWRDVPDELHQVSHPELQHELLPREPAELELSVIELEDGGHSRSMICREPRSAGATEITSAGGWREYLHNGR